MLLLCCHIVLLFTTVVAQLFPVRKEKEFPRKTMFFLSGEWDCTTHWPHLAKVCALVFLSPFSFVFIFTEILVWTVYTASGRRTNDHSLRGFVKPICASALRHSFPFFDLADLWFPFRHFRTEDKTSLCMMWAKGKALAAAAIIMAFVSKVSCVSHQSPRLSVQTLLFLSLSVSLYLTPPPLSLCRRLSLSLNSYS